MGISDDITPKKKHHNVKVLAEPDFVDENKKEDAKKIKETDFFEQKNENIKDSFFPIAPKTDKVETKEVKDSVEIEHKKKSEKKKNNKTKEARATKRGFNFRLIFVLLFVILILGVVFYRDQIKNLWPKSSDDTSSTSSVTVVPKDYATSSSTSTSTDSSTSTTTDTTASSSSSATADTTTTTTATYTKSAVKIEILNGNGVNKAGDAAKKLLVAAGFTVSKTANADSFKYTNTYIYYKTGFADAAKDIQTALSKPSASVSNNNTKCTTYDVVIILGSK